MNSKHRSAPLVIGGAEDKTSEPAVLAEFVSLAGGNQLRITSLLGGSKIDTVLNCGREENGLVLAGTSAGATAMSTVMIIEGRSRTNPAIDTVENGLGMGLISDVVIDMHFAERGRLGRLLTAVAQHPGHLGIGIDENTGIVVEGRMFRVIGQRAVTILDASHLSYSSLEMLGQDEHALALCHICLHNLPSDYQFDLDRREPIIPPKPAAVATEQEH